jgi:type I restriction enzyme, S subunit
MQELQKYKKTEIGEIPEEWKAEKISDNSVLKGRIGWQGLTTAEYRQKGEFYLVTGTDFKDGKIDWKNCVYVDKERYVQDENIQLKKNDVLVTKDGTIGKIAFIDILPKPTTLNSGIFVIRPINKAYFPLFMYYVLRSDYFINFLNRLKAGSTINHLYQKDFVNFYFLVPPYPEQQKISSILSNVDELIQKTERIIEQSQRLKKGIIQRLLTKGIGHTKFKDSFYDSRFKVNIPHEWDIQQLERIAKVIDVRHSTPKYTEKGYPLILPNNVKPEGLVLTNTKFTTEEDYLYMIGGNRKPEFGDIIYSRNASFGIACRVETNEKFSLGQDLVLIKPEKIHSYLLYVILNSKNVLSQVNRLSTGSTFKRINLNLIRNFLIILPTDQEEQQKIANYIQNIENFIQKFIKEMKILTYLKKGLMQQLLTGKIRVKV